MIEITDSMRESRKKKLEEIESRIDRAISCAAEKGYSHCCFMIYCGINGSGGSESIYYDDIRRKYESAGYRICPTGYIGGVYQNTESIYW